MSDNTIAAEHPELRRRIEDARQHMKHQGTGVWTDKQLLASYALAVIKRGYHHCYRIKPRGQSGVEMSVPGGMSSFDFDDLTRAVLVAHQMGVRIELTSSGPRMIKVMAHVRCSSDDVELCFADRHPTLDWLAKECLKWKFIDFSQLPEQQGCASQTDEKLPVNDATATQASLLNLLADIRAAVGDPHGKLMQDELVQRCRDMHESVKTAHSALLMADDDSDYSAHGPNLVTQALAKLDPFVKEGGK